MGDNPLMIAHAARLAPVFLLLFLSPLLAHDLWLEADAFRLPSPGELIVVRAGNGTIYAHSENAVAPARLARLLLLGPDGNPLAAPTPEVHGDWLHLPFTPQAAGTYWLAVATKPNKIRLSGQEFTEYLQHDGIPAVLEQRERDGISDRDEVEQYSKYVKALFQVGASAARDCSRPLGLEIEILPLENPYRLSPGGTLPVRVLFRGAPLPGLTLHAGFAGQSGKAFQVDTDAAGEARIPLSQAGRWYIRGIHLFRVDTQDHSYESYWTTLTFEVGSNP